MAQLLSSIASVPSESVWVVPTITIDDISSSGRGGKDVKKLRRVKKTKLLEGQQNEIGSDISLGSSCERFIDKCSCAQVSLAENMERAHSVHYSSDEFEETFSSDTAGDHSDSSDDDNPRSQMDRLIEEGTLYYMDDENSALSSEDETDDDSESDITDVSPIPSACSSPIFGPSPVLPRRSFPISVRHSYCEQRENPLDMNLMMASVLEVEKQLKNRENNPKNRYLHPIRDNPNHKHLRNMSKHKKNMSFSNEEVRNIDRENNILLSNIISIHKRRKPRSNSYSSYNRQPSSAINRKKEEERINSENLVLLRKLNEASPSKYLSRARLSATIS